MQREKAVSAQGGERGGVMIGWETSYSMETTVRYPRLRQPCDQRARVAAVQSDVGHRLRLDIGDGPHQTIEERLAADQADLRLPSRRCEHDNAVCLRSARVYIEGGVRPLT